MCAAGSRTWDILEVRLCWSLRVILVFLLDLCLDIAGLARKSYQQLVFSGKRRSQRVHFPER